MRFRMPMRRQSPGQSFGGRRRSGKFKILPLVLLGLFALYYYQSNTTTVPLTGRKQLVDMSKSEEMALGLSSYSQILNQSDVVTSGPALDQIRSIGKRLIKVIDDAEGFEWEFNLIESDQANAFCLPGGKVAVYTGILPVAKNIDGLAVIISHEIAHAVARHGAERMAYQKLQQYGQLALGMSVGEMAPQTQRMVMGAFGMGSKFGFMLPYSRKHETEADYMGLIYLARSCYNPEEAPRLWERMKKANPETPSEFTSTHPDPENRIADFEGWMAEAKAEYAKHCG